MLFALIPAKPVDSCHSSGESISNHNHRPGNQHLQWVTSPRVHLHNCEHTWWQCGRQNESRYRNSTEGTGIQLVPLWLRDNNRSGCLSHLSFLLIFLAEDKTQAPLRTWRMSKHITQWNTKGCVRHADGLQLVIETEPLAGSVLQIHADIWSAFSVWQGGHVWGALVGTVQRQNDSAGTEHRNSRRSVD